MREATALTDVFISYASSSRDCAGDLARAVEALGFSVWWDSALLPHDTWGSTIEKELDGARAVIVLWSKDARDSRWVRAEATRALDAGKLIQAAVDEVVPPMPFDQVQFVSLADWYGEQDHPGWQRIAASLRHILSGEAGPARLAAMPAPPASRETEAPLALGGIARALPGWAALVVLATVLVAALPLLLGHWALPEPLGFLASPLSSLMIVILMAALTVILPRLPSRLLTALFALSVLLALGSGIAHLRLTERFLVPASWSKEPVLLGCGIPEQRCTALSDNGYECPSPAAMCPLAPGQDLESILVNYGFDPADFYGEGLDEVKYWLWLSWNGLFIGIALAVTTALSQALKPQIRRVMRQTGI